MTYQEWLDYFRQRWKPGQHVLLIGATGSGKTVAARDMLLLRKYVVAVATKSKDKSLDSYGFAKISSWPPSFYLKRVLFWVKPKALGDFSAQAIGIYRVLADIFKRGGWCVYFDDLIYVVNTLGLKAAIRMMYTQVRSQNVSLVGSLQRPYWAPLECISQSSYALVFRIRDGHDIKRLAEGFSVSYQELLQAIQSLKEYEFVFLATGAEPVHVERKL